MGINRSSKLATTILLLYSAVFAAPAVCWVTGADFPGWLLMATSLVALTLLYISVFGSAEKKQEVAKVLPWLGP